MTLLESFVMKRLCAALLTLCLVLPIAGCGAAPAPGLSADAIRTYRDIPGVTGDEIRDIEALKSERGFFTYGACLATEAFPLPDGSTAGFASMLCGLLSELFDAEFRLSLYDWDRLMESLESGELDFTGELTPTEERMGVFTMTSPIAVRMLRVFTTVDAKIKTEADVGGLRIGFLTDSVTADSVAEKYHYEFQRVDVDNYDIAAAMLRDGDIDAFIGEAVADPAFAGYPFIRSQVLFPMVHSPVSLTTSSLSLAPVISVVDKYIEAGGLDKLYAFYKDGELDYAKHKLRASFTDEEKAFIEELAGRGGAISVAYEHDNYPVNFFNTKEDAYEGIAVDVLAEIGRLIDLEFTPAVGKDATWAEIYEGLNTGEIHMVAQLLRTEDRGERFIWSEKPYAATYYALISKSGYPNLEIYQVARTSVGAVKNSGKLDKFRELFPDHKTLIEYDTQNDCLDALERGDVELLMGSEYNLLAEQNYREKSGLKINIKLDSSLDSYFGFNKSDPVLCSIINKAQEYVLTDVIEIGWTGRSYDYSKRMSEQRTMYLSIFIAALFLVLGVTVAVLIKNVRLGKKLEEIANYDSLTEIFNRRYFLDLADLQISRSLRLRNDCFVAIYDLDHFKAVNDTYGHLAGDKVLKEIAQRVKKAIRPYDLLGRYGGEEFILLLCDTDEENVMNAVDRIRLEINAAPVEYEGRMIPISASFGVARVSRGDDVMTATRYADEALYQAKEAGRNRVVFYNQEARDTDPVSVGGAEA
ncbi:MAG: GGDEF domain-containing protein [Clostridiales bacterium]|nr:GGDEF domain-containing protein [Clostridiales bacterium]